MKQMAVFVYCKKGAVSLFCRPEKHLRELYNRKNAKSKKNEILL